MIRVSLILAFAWCAARLLRNRTAAERHLLWLLALVTASLLPALTLIVPAWRPAAAARIAAALPALTKALAVQQAQRASGAIVHAVGIEPEGGIPILLFAIWIAGTTIVLGRMCPGARIIRRLAARSQATPTPKWIQAGIRRKVRLLLCPDSSLPVTWGVFRPEILLPSDFNEWSADRRFSVLAHEVAHIQRCDWLFQILAEVACAIYWFHPLFWVARNQLHLESERACDDAVLERGVDGKEYAQHLLDIARSLKRPAPTWSLAMAGQVHLERRLIAVLKPGSNRRSMTWTTAAAVCLPILCLVVPIAAVRAPVASTAVPQVIRYTMPPLYSDEGRRRKIEGIVKIDAWVDADGRPRDLRVARGLGFGLDENALLAVRSWKFSPGSHAESTVQVDVEFSLRNAELNELIANDMVTNVGPDVTPPRIVHRVEAHYPDAAPVQRPAGNVLLDAVIQDDGIPKVLRVVRSLSWEIDEAAIAALEQWKFSPAERDGVPVKVRMNIEMIFAPATN